MLYIGAIVKHDEFFASAGIVIFAILGLFRAAILFGRVTPRGRLRRFISQNPSTFDAYIIPVTFLLLFMGTVVMFGSFKPVGWEFRGIAQNILVTLGVGSSLACCGLVFTTFNFGWPRFLVPPPVREEMDEFKELERELKERDKIDKSVFDDLRKK